MKALDIYKKISDGVFLLLDWFCRLLILYMTLIVFAQVVLRGMFKMNISWGEETVLLAMVWMTFAAMSIGVKEEAHIRIEFFMSRFPKSFRKGIVVFDNVVLLVVNGFMVYFGWQLIPISALTSCLVLLGKLFGLYKTRGEKNFIEGVYEEESLTEEEE